MIDKGTPKVTDEMRAMFEKALVEAQPQDALHLLAKSLKADGVDQVTIYQLFAEYQRTLAGSDPQYDAIVNNMDLIWGGSWAKGEAIFDTELRHTDFQ